MKRDPFLKHLARQGCRPFREGAKHTIYWNPANRMTSSIPRHSELVNGLVRKIRKDLGVADPWSK